MEILFLMGMHIQASTLSTVINEEGSSLITVESAQISKLHDPVRMHTILLKDKDHVVGGIDGYFFYGSYIIDVLWVEKERRHKGIGTRLLKLAEEAAQKGGASFVQVSTMSHWNCTEFYEKNGYIKESEPPVLDCP